MKTDSKLNDFLTETAAMAANGKLSVIEAKSRIYLMQQHLRQFETPPTTERIEIVEDEMSRKLRRDFQRFTDAQKLVVAAVARDRKSRRRDYADDPTFRAALLAVCNGNDSFASVMIERLKELDGDFFASIGRAIGVMKGFRLSRKLAEQGITTGSPEVFANHVFHTLCVGMEIRKARMMLPDSFTMRMIVSEWVGDDAYEVLSHWRSVWKAAGIAMKSPNPGRAKARFDLAYRRFMPLKA